MSKLARISIVVVGVLILGAYYMYNKPHRDVVNADVSEFVTLDGIYQEFESNESQALQNYHDKVIVISARLLTAESISEQLASAQLEGATGRANCQLHKDQNLDDWTSLIGEEVKVKGLFVGFDDLLGEIQLKEVTFYHE